jgi:autotransporter-associated beta strand protein
MNLNGLSDYYVRYIYFTSNATQSRTLNSDAGRTLYLNANNGDPKIENNSSATHTFNVPIVLNNWAELNPVDGDLVFNGSLAIGSNTLKIYGNNSKTITFSGVLSGTGNFEVNQNSIVKFSNSNTYSGATNINAGILELQGDLSSSTITVASGAKLRINGENVDINALTIYAGGEVEILAGKSLTINGTLTNNAANGIVLKSPSNHGVPGSLITKGSVAGSGTVKAERYIQAYTTDTDGWHLFASPFDNFDITGTNLEPSSVPENEDDFFYWDEAIGDAGTWMNWKVTPFNLMAGKGYLVAYHNDELKEMTGTPFNTDKLFNDLSYENPHPTYHNTWHLLGNPFTCSLVWNSDVDGNLSNDWLLSGIGGIAKLMNVQDGSYFDLGVGDNIPSMQGFFVSIENADNSITIPMAARVHGSKDWYKSSSVQKLLIIANDLETGKKQQSVLQVNELATEGYDYQYDSRFWAWYAPQFYSEAGDELLSTNTLPSLPAETVIPFGFVKNDASNFSIELVESLAGYTVYLSDLKTGTEQNLTDNPVYTFTAEAGDDPNRFLLHFGTVGIDKPANDSQVSILVRDNNLLISGASANAEIVVTNLLGQVVLQGKAGNAGLTVIGTGSLNDGIYVVTVVSGKQAVSKKISIR